MSDQFNNGCLHKMVVVGKGGFVTRTLDEAAAVAAFTILFSLGFDHNGAAWVAPSPRGEAEARIDSLIAGGRIK